MGNNPVEDNFVTRFLLGLAVIFAMMIGGGAIGGAFLSLGVPYGDWLGVAVGSVLVFVAFVVLYRRYDASYDTE
ncbi:hypothetical protein [Halomarina pelagica]|uniref:hypothetical protein n=1 Tax=Halomarina pelagica TaxID=2961599 RepID=UPI0020C4C132|nr:hypothetical protein [Halomarina sp. BND7]